MIYKVTLIAASVLFLSGGIGSAEPAAADSWHDQGHARVAWGDCAVELQRGANAITLGSLDEAVEIIPRGPGRAEAGTLDACRFGRPGVEATFREGISLALDVSRRGVLTITPSGAVASVLLRAPIAIGMLPGLRLEEVLYSADALPDTAAVCVPVHNCVAGLLRGGNGMLVCAWPDGGQRVTLHLEGADEERLIAGIEIALDGAPIHLGLLAAPAVWHRQELSLRQYERDAEMDWRPPFEAQYRTQLPVRGETTTLRSFVFRMEREELPRPEVGSHIWPVWFDNGRPMIHVSKRIPPRGDAIVYPYDHAGKSLLGFLGATPVGQVILERNKRAPLPHGPRGAANVGFVACGGTHILRNTLYAWGLQSRERAFLDEHTDLLADYVSIIQQKNMAYFAFIEKMREQIGTWRKAHEADAALCTFFDAMLLQVAAVEKGHVRKMELYEGKTAEEHIAEADRCAARLKELLDTPGPEVALECDYLVDRMNQLSWGHDEATGMRFSMLTRAWAQEAARACANLPEALPYAQVLRAAIRDALNGAPPW